MTQVERVRRRMVEATCAADIRKVADSRGWRHDAVVDLLLLCGGDIRRVNEHWRALRQVDAGVGHTSGDRAYRLLFDYIAARERDR